MPCLSARCRATGRSRRCQSHPARQSSVIIQTETIRGLRASSEVKAARSGAQVQPRRAQIRSQAILVRAKECDIVPV